jgi:hypothetical protein
VSTHPLAERIAQLLIRQACRRLPDDARDERYLEWTAELPHILNDPDVRLAGCRVARALLFAADQARGTRRLPEAKAARRSARAPARPANSPENPTLLKILREATESTGRTVRLSAILVTVFAGVAGEIYAAKGIHLKWSGFYAPAMFSGGTILTSGTIAIKRALRRRRPPSGPR